MSRLTEQAQQLATEVQKLDAQLEEAAEVVCAVLEWARTPGDHGGNPYSHQFVKMADEVFRAATGKEYSEVYPAPVARWGGHS